MEGHVYTLALIHLLSNCLLRCFTCRWTDKLNGLLRTAKFYLQARLVRLDLGCVRLAKDPSSSLLEPLAALTALSDLRMSVYSNGDATLTLQLSELSALSNLQVGLWLVLCICCCLHQVEA